MISEMVCTYCGSCSLKWFAHIGAHVALDFQGITRDSPLFCMLNQDPFLKQCFTVHLLPMTKLLQFYFENSNTGKSLHAG